MGAGKGNKDSGAFSGFTPQALEFLRGLAGNNSKPWFEAHREEYEQHLLAP